MTDRERIRCDICRVVLWFVVVGTGHVIEGCGCGARLIVRRPPPEEPARRRLVWRDTPIGVPAETAEWEVVAA